MTIGERIKEIRTINNLNQADFAERIGAKRSSIASYESGLRNPLDSVIKSISREYKVNEEWLRTGNGEMIPSESEDAQLFAWMGEQLAKGTTSPDFQTRTLDLLRQLKPEHWKALEEIAVMIYEAEKKHRGE